MRVLLAGASGTLGGPLVRRLVEAGHDVTGLARQQAGAAAIRQRGATPVLADVLDRTGLLRAVDGREFDAVLHELTALKKAPLRHADMRPTDLLRTQGTAHLLAAAEATGARRFLTQSIVFGYGYYDHGTEPLTEDSPFGEQRGDASDEHVAAMASTERQTMTASGIEGIALRYGLFYGADIESMVTMLRKRMLPVVRGGGEIPFVHHEDAASATVAALERGVGGRAYNIVDDTPGTFSDLVREVASVTSATKPLTVPDALLAVAAPYGKVLFGPTSMRVSNALAKAELGWTPQYASFKAGVAASRS